MLYGMANNGVIIPAERDGALYNFLLGNQDYIFEGIGNEFAITPSSSSFLITLGTGEGVVCGRHVTEETVNGANSMIQLSANSSGYVTICVDLSRPAGTEAYLRETPTLAQDNLNNAGTVHDLPLYQFTTNGSGVSSFVDVRNISSGSNVVCELDGGNLYVKYYEDGAITRKQVGSLDPANLTATPGDVKSGMLFGGAGSDEVQTGTFAGQGKTVTASTSAQTVYPDAGFYLTSVTVNAFTYVRNSKQGNRQVIDLGSTKNGYYFATVYNGSARVQGSNDNANWTNLKTVTAAGSNAGFAGGISSGSGTATYRYFRMDLTGYNNGQTGDCTLMVAG